MSPATIPSLKPVSWGVALTVSWRSLKRRLLRSLITMSGVVLGIAFLVYMRVTDDVTNALIAVNDPLLNQRLQEKGVDIYSQAGADRMMLLLIALSLVICTVGIVNAMLMSVTERVKEIGTLKCLGALDSFIVRAYFIESSLQGVFGTVLGLVLGVAVAIGVNAFSFRGAVFAHFPPGPVALSLLLGLVLGSLMSVAAAVGPALFAARKEPVEAMRVEE